MREDVADLLATALAGVKPDAIAVGMNATRTLVCRWLDARWSDKRPAPLAMLLALDAADFDAVIARLIEARKERGL